jgi:hypothetical protein
LATISSAVCRFLAILASSSWREAIPQGGPLLREQGNPPPMLGPVVEQAASLAQGANAAVPAAERRGVMGEVDCGQDYLDRPNRCRFG